MPSARANSATRHRFSLQIFLWGVTVFFIAGLVVAFCQDNLPADPAPSPVQEVIEQIAEVTESLPVPDPPPAPTPPPPQPEKTPPAPVFAPPSAGEVNAPAPSPPPVRAASDVDFPTPTEAPANEPLVMIGRPATKADYGSGGNLRASQLRSMPPHKFTFDRSTLRDVLRLLAQEAGIPYIGIPENSPQAQNLVSFKMTASPFTALESLARQNDIKLSFEDGVWFMRALNARAEQTKFAEDQNELVGIIYQLKHDPADQIVFSGAAGGGGPSDSGSPAFTNQGQAGGGGGISSPNIPLQNPQTVFANKTPRLVNDVRAIVGLKPLKFDQDTGALVDEDIEKGVAIPGSLSEARESGERTSGEASGEGPAREFVDLMREESRRSLGIDPIYVPPQSPQVIYNSDSNILWVVATRKQHKWVSEYLQKVDKPQDLIAIEVKFFETNKNPQTDFGINWEGVFGGDGLQVTGQGSVGNPGVQGGGGELGGFTLAGQPYSAVLSVQQATLAIQAFTREREGSLVQYPRVLTINNREVAITSAENTPVNVGTSNVGGGITGGNVQTVGQIEYLPTGTQINILPKTVGNDQIALTVAITISSIIDQVPINLGTGFNEYPVTAERVYNASLQVNSGYTLAVGGLEKSTDLRNTGGVPVLKDIPGLGYLFKNKSRDRRKSNLIIFITPFVISDPSKTPGISETPQSTVPVRPGLPPPAPTFAPGGQLVGGLGALPGAFTWLEYQLKYFRQINSEARDDAKTIGELRGVIERARMLSAELQAQVADGAGYATTSLLDDSARAEALLFELNKVLAAAQLDQFQLNQGFP